MRRLLLRQWHHLWYIRYGVFVHLKERNTTNKCYLVAGMYTFWVWACSNNKFACNLSLCSSKDFTVKGATILDNEALRADLGNYPTTTTSAATCSATRAPPEEQCKELITTTGNIPTGGAIGIGVGIGIPPALATASFAVPWLRKRRKMRARQSEKQQHEAVSKGAWSSTQYAPLTLFQRRDGGGIEPPRSEIMGTPRHEPDG